jgi:hypothetical protein
VNIDGINKCFSEKGSTYKENTTLFKLERKKFPGHKNSINLFKKCNSYYDIKDVPTTIIYFDEVRRGKSKEKVGIFN